MPASSGLRRRFTLASMALVLVISSLSALAVYLAQEYMEDHLLEQLMQREVDEYARLYRGDPAQVPPRSTGLHSYVVDPGDLSSLPAELREIPPGIWHDVLIQGRNYQIANFTLLDKRLYLAYDITDVEQRESWLTLVLAGVVLLATVLAGLLGWRLSRVVVAPVARLAAEITGLQPGRPEPGLTERFADADLGAIAAAFDAYARRLAEFVVRERTFTEDVSHELRTPISVVATATERLEADAALPAALRPTVERIARASRQMQLTTQALLFMAREAEPPEAAMRVVPLRQVLEEVVATHERELAQKGFTLSTAFDGAGPDVPAGLAAIVVGNLLGNAIRHSGANAAELAQRGAQVTVRDQGAGIPPQELPRIFERHYRGPRSGGVGLGLHIVKRICDRQGWAIEARSEPGRETVLTVHFAAAR
jgi:signal transduction histidine kinase